MNRRAFLAALVLIIALAGCGGYDGGGRDEPPEEPAQREREPGCCKICTLGQACGDTCISRSYQCHVGPGCACDG